MKKTLAIAILFAGIFTFECVAQLKIGYTNPLRILNELPEVIEIDKTIENFIIEKNSELADKATNLQQIFSDYENNMSAMSQQQRTQREEELLELNEQFEAERTKMMNEVQQKRNELLQPVIERMNKAMAEVAEELGLDLILNDGTSTGDAIIFYASDEKLDVTERIVNKLK